MRPNSLPARRNVASGSVAMLGTRTRHVSLTSGLAVGPRLFHRTSAVYYQLLE